MRRHPWIFAGAVAHLKGRARAGDTVDVFAHDGRPLGRAAFSPHSQIRARLWTFDAEETIDHAFFKRRVAAAVAAREALPELRGQQGLRLIHGESDGLPGVIADRYGDTVVLQLNSAGAEKWRDALVAALVQATGCARIFERSDSDVRGLEGLEARTGFLHGEDPQAGSSSRSTASAWRWTSRPATRPASISTSARTGGSCASCPPGAACSTASATPAASACRRWPAAQRRCCRSTAPARRWNRRRATWR
jgi:hypothetical protein